MNIAIVINDAYSYAGTEKICNFMARCFSERYSVDILSLKGSGNPFYNYPDNCKLKSFENSRYPIISLMNYINNGNYTLVYTISMGKLSIQYALLSMLFSKVRKGKNIACEHVSYNSFNFPIRILKRIFLKFYTAVVVLTHQDSQKLVSLGIKSISIPNPVVVKPPKETQRSFNALAAGRLVRQKGFQDLLDIWSIFIKKNNNWNLKIAGDGELYTELQEKIKELHLENSVTLLGRVDDMDSLYENSDIFLMTSLYEGLPLVLLEAKSWGLPLISFDCPTGPRQLIENGKDGFLIEHRDKVLFSDKIEILIDNEIYKDMSINSRNDSLNYRPEVIKDKWFKLMIGILDIKQ